MAHTVINLNVEVKLRECEYPDTEVARLIQKLVDEAVAAEVDLEDSVHEEILDDMINVEVSAK